LAGYNIEDVGVQERPLEEVIAEMFAEVQEVSEPADQRIRMTTS
jgi:hypothetical protein